MPNNADDPVRLPTLLAELRDDGFAPFPYRRLAEAARDGIVPARLRNGQWYARRADKARIAAAMGMKRTPAPTRRQSAQSVSAA